MPGKKILFLSLSLALLTQPAFAREPEIFSPLLESKKYELEYNGFFDLDDNSDKNGAWHQEASFVARPTDSWETEIEAGLLNEEDSDVDFGQLTWRNIVNLAGPDKYWAELGLLGEYTRNFEEDTNTLGARVLVVKTVGQYENLVNLHIAQELEDSETSGGIDYRGQYYRGGIISPGFEIFTNFGSDNEHMAGPMAYGEYGNLEFQAGYLFGVGDGAPDGTIKIGASYKF